MSKFKVGDLVRVTNPKVAARFNEVFTVTEVMDDTWRATSYSSERLQQIRAERGDRWYRGDSKGHGVWENYLELVEVTR